MISLLRRYRKPLFVAMIAIFLIGTFVGLGGYLFTENDMTSAVASVGKIKIPYSQYMVRVNNYADALRAKGAEVSDEMMGEIKQGVLRDLIVDELLVLKAKEMGIIVSDQELARDIQSTQAFQVGGQFSQDEYFRRVRQTFRDSPEAYEQQRRKQIQSTRLKQLIFHSAKLTPAELRDAYAQEKKGSLKDFEKEKDSFAAQAQQKRALELINYYLRQTSTQVEIRTYLEQRERGV